MYYEKLGFMLIFWNLAGVPLSYCHCTLYLANHPPSVYRWNRFGLVLLYISYLFVYWIWDTTNSQKNRFRQYERGTLVERKAFPQLPWQTVKNPKTIKTKSGDAILVDGWCMSRYFHFLKSRHTNCAIRWICTQDSLHRRPLFCFELGLNRGLWKSISMVLSPILCIYDFPPSNERHTEM